MSSSSLPAAAFFGGLGVTVPSADFGFRPGLPLTVGVSESPPGPV